MPYAALHGLLTPFSPVAEKVLVRRKLAWFPEAFSAHPAQLTASIAGLVFSG